MSQKNRLFISICIGIAGIAVLLRSYIAIRPPANDGEVMKNAPVSEFVKSELDPARFQSPPTAETIPDILEKIRLMVIQKGGDDDLMRSVGEDGLEDLGDAFVERLHFMFMPDLERDYSASVSRGEPLSKEEWAARYGKYIKTNNKKSMPAIDPSALELTILRHDFIGREMQQSAKFGQGFGISTGKRGDPLPAPDEPVATGAMAVEIVMPMMQMEMLSKEMRPAIVGFHFAWNSTLKKWIPYESVVYKVPGSGFAPPRL